VSTRRRLQIRGLRAAAVLLGLLAVVGCSSDGSSPGRDQPGAVPGVADPPFAQPAGQP